MLALAVCKGCAFRSSCPEACLDSSALVRYTDASKCNALHDAGCYRRQAPLICALIKHGVDPTAVNARGQTPAEMVRQAGHTLQATLLDRASEDKRKRDRQGIVQSEQMVSSGHASSRSTSLTNLTAPSRGVCSMSHYVLMRESKADLVHLNSCTKFQNTIYQTWGRM